MGSRYLQAKKNIEQKVASNLRMVNENECDQKGR